MPSCSAGCLAVGLAAVVSFLVASGDAVTAVSLTVTKGSQTRFDDRDDPVTPRPNEAEYQRLGAG